jgi:hypothetical protein
MKDIPIDPSNIVIPTLLFPTVVEQDGKLLFWKEKQAFSYIHLWSLLFHLHSKVPDDSTAWLLFS